MILTKAFSLLLLLCTAHALTAQGIHGSVFDDDDYAMTGATVRWENGTGTTVDADGHFHLMAEAGQDRFSISYLGYATANFFTDTLELSLEITLSEEGNDLATVEVTGRDRGSFTSTLSGRAIESLSAKELTKAPCCALAESFENSPVVDLNYGDPLTGRREIQVLGLRGTYTQLTLENRPFMTGLASPYALDLIPGPWVEGIQVGKGAGALTSGASGLTGQVNTELFKPTTDVPVYLNLFAGSQGRGEANLRLNSRLGDKLYGGALLHGSFTGNDGDRDNDGFENMPDRETLTGLFRLFRLGEDDWMGQWNLLVSQDNRSAGQLEGTGNRPAYRIDQDNEHVELFSKTGFLNLGRDHRSIGLQYSGSYHRLNNRYGNRRHQGEQRSGYLNALYQTEISDSRHGLLIGAGLTADYYAETLGERDFGRMERTAGVFAEYTYNEDPISLLLGMRLDHHNLGGWQASPRATVKFSPNEETAIRLSTGRGWRAPNLLVENLSWLPSSRRLVIPNDGFNGLETSWNYNLSLTKNLNLAERNVQIVVDLYRTAFGRQIVLDAEHNLEELFFQPLENESRANGVLVSFDYEVLPLIDVKLAYKFTDAQARFAGEMRQMPLTPRHRILSTLGYDGRRVKAHLNYQFLADQRTVFGPAEDFGLLNLNLTFVANDKLEIYGGAENLTDRVQENAILGAADPFGGGYFDASQVYQPLFGRRFYVGVRYVPTL